MKAEQLGIFRCQHMYMYNIVCRDIRICRVLVTTCMQGVYQSLKSIRSICLAENKQMPINVTQTVASQSGPFVFFDHRWNLPSDHNSHSSFNLLN